MTSMRRFLIALTALVLLPVAAAAATTEFRVLIDADNNTATGCTLGGMTGVEHVLVTVVRTDATSGQVVRSYRLTCSGGTSLGSPIDVNESGWSVGFNPASGGMTVENRLAWSILTGNGMPTGLRFGFDAATGGSVHSATANANGSSIIYPPKAGKRHAVGTGPQARTFQLDGNTNDWGAITPLVNGIASGGNKTVRIIQVYAFANPSDEFLYFRFDANVGSDAPFAEDDNYNRTPGQGLTVPAPGVLANDGDPNGQPLTAMPVSPAAHGDVTLNADGSFTYAPNDPASTQTDTFEYKANNGAQDSNVAKVTIKVSAVANHAPVAQNDNPSTNEDQQLTVPAPGVLGNDGDADGDVLTATKLTDPSHGTVVVNPDGSFTYTPQPNYFGSDSFTYEVSDGTDSATATVTVTITSVNDAPTVNPATFSVDENSPAGTAVGTVTGGDIDGDSLGFSITGGNTGGAFAISSSGNITVANSSALDFETTPTFSLTVTATDNGVPAANGSATITINVGDRNEAPIAADDAGTVAEDGTLSVPAPGVLSNDSDEDGDALTAAKTSNPANGVATVAANGAWTYTPNANFNGTDSFTYQVTDGSQTDTATVTITVTAVNDAPVNTVPGPQTMPEDGTLVFSAANGNAISMSDIDAGSNVFNGTVACTNCVLQVTVVPGAVIQWNNTNTVLIEGTLAQVNAALSSVTFTPNPDVNGSVTLRVVADDRGSTGAGTSLSDTDDIVINITEVNDPPTATNDAATTQEDTPLVLAAATLTVNDSSGPANESGQSRTVTAVSPTSAQGGTVTLVAGTITYTPPVNYNGPDSFTYTVTDNGTTNGAAAPQSAVGTVNVTVTEVNDAPVATDDATGAAEDTPLVFAASTLTTNDAAGPANESGQSLTVTAVSPTSTQGGTVTLVGGNITYTPPANYNGPDSFTYTVTDNGTSNGISAPLSDTATVSVTVTAVNDAPVLTVTGAVTHTEGGAATNLATAATINDVDDTNIESATIRISGNFAAGQDVLSFVNTPQITGSFAGDTLTLTGSASLASYAAALQAVQYTNTSDTPSTLQRTITWTVNDGNNNSNSQNTTLDVTATNDAPVNTVPGAQTVGEDAPLTFSTAGSNAISISDVDAAADDVQVTLNVTNGTVTLNPSATAALTSLTGDGTGTVVAVGTVAEINAALNGMSFTSTPNYNGAAAIQIVTNDLGNNPSGALSDTDSVAITVTAVNDAPVLTVTGAVTHTEGGAATNLATAANITDLDDTNIEGATIRITGNFAAGQDVLSFVNTPQITGNVVGDTLTLTGTDTIANYAAALQAVQYTNTSDAPSTLQRTITWTVTDGDNTSNTQTTTLDITATNDAPVNTVATGQATGEDTALVINGASIADADAASDDVQITLNVTGGTVTLDATATGALTSLTGDGTATVVAAGTVAEINAALSGMTFNPTADTNGTASIQMVTDDLGNNPSGNLTDTDSFNITVNAVNDVPVLTVTGAATHTEGGAATNLATAANITDIDDTNIEGATIRITGNFAAGQDVLSFVNTPQITGNFVGDTLTLTGTGTIANYIAALQAVQYTNTSDTPSTLQRTITWTVTDGDGNSNTQTTTLDVTATNDAPVNTVPVGLSTGEDTPLVINGASIADADAASDDVQITLNVTGGTVTLDATATGALTSLTGDGTAAVVATGTVAEINAALSGMTFTPTADSSGTASIQMVTDDLGNNPSGNLTDTDSFNITVNAANDAPVLTVTGSPTFAENGAAVALASTVNITDVDDTNLESATITITNAQTGDVLNFVNTATITGNFAGGALTLNGSDTKAAYIAALQSITFSNASDNPSTTQRAITWVVNDGDSNSNTQNTTVDVTATNDAPVNTVPGTQSTNEDTPLSLGSMVSVSDVDANPDDVQVTLNVTNGTVTLNAAATGALTSLTGDGTATVVATGTVAEVNAALNGASFSPSLDFSGTASIQVVTNDLGNNPSGALSDTDSFDITVNNTNDAPVLTVAGSPTFAENGAAVDLTSSVNITDVDDTNIESAVITITNAQTGDVLNFVNTVNITGNFAGGVLTLTGSDTKAAYIAALDSITFSNASDNPSLTQRTITWRVNDGDTNSNVGNTTVDVTATNDAPVNTVAVGVSTNEDTPVVINGASISDPDADPDAVQITLNVTSGTVALDPTATGALDSLTGNGSATVVATGTVAEINAALSGMTFTPTADFNGTASIEMVTNDLGNNPSGAITDTDSFNVSVNAVNDPPSFTPGANVSINEDHGPYSETAWATNISAGPTDENAQGLSMNATVSNTTGTLTFATAPTVNVVTGNLTFQANANTCGTATVDVTLTDDAGTVGVPGDDLSSATHVLTITVQCVNDAPSFTKGSDQTVDEDAGAQTVNPWATGISAGPGETDGLTFNVTNNNNPLFTAGGQPAVSSTGVLTYTPAPNANGTTIVTVTLTDDGGTPGVPADDVTTGPQTFNITVTALNDAPSFTIASDPPFVVLGAGAQTVNAFATSINDGDPEATQVLTFNLSQTGSTGNLSFPVGAGAPAIDPATGNLTYTPNAGTHGTVTFSVTLSDDGASGGSNVNISGTQSFTIAVEKAPEVTTTTPADNATGVSTSTNITVNFDEPVSVTLSPASFKINCNAGPDLAFAYVGGTTNVTSVTLDPTATLPAGNCVVTVVANEIHDTDANDPPDGLAADYVFDFVTNTPPTATDDANTALGHVTLTVNDASGVLANDSDPDAGADMDVQNFGTPIATTQGGTITFTKEGGYTYNAQAGDQNLTDTVTYTVTDQFGGTDTGTLTINLGQRFIYVDDDHPTATPDGRDIHPWKTMQQAQANSAPGDTILVKSGSYTDHIVLQASQNLIGQGIGANHTHTHNAVVFTVLTSGGAPTISRAAAGDTVTLSTNNTIRGAAIGSTSGKAIFGSNFGTLTVNDNVTVNANGNAALHLDTGAVNATFNSVSGSAGANSALIFNALTGTLNINAGALSNTAGATLNLTGGSMAGTIAANISTTGSSLVNVASRTANTLTLSGTLSGSGTIAASGNAAGTILNFSGTQSLTTGANAGVNLSANPGTINFTGGALQIGTTSGAGFIASGATGNVNVTGATNTITTTTGIPLQMTGGVDIGGSGVTFRSITANGAASGIVLADTGANAFTVAGTGSAGTGGTLQSIAGSAVSLTNTNNVNLNHLTVNGAGTGITGSAFGTLTLRDLAVTAASGLNLTNGTVNTAPAATAFTSLNTSGGTNGVAMTTVNGSFNVAAGTLTGATGSTFLVNGGNVSGTWTTNITQGNNAAVLDISNGHSGALTFPGTVSATNGTGVQFSNADGSYNFSGTTTLNGGDAGVDILAGSGGTFTFGSGATISGPANPAFRINGSAPTQVSYSGAITANAGRAVEVSYTGPATGACGSNNTFSGSITSSGATATGILVDRCSSGSVAFTGTSKTLGTQANTGVTVTNNGATVTFSNGGLAITRTTGAGIVASGGGTLIITRDAGAANTIGSGTSGAALDVNGVTIGTGGLVFQSIAQNGGANGIVLNNTGATAGLTVTGTGAADSGGIIQNTTGHGVSLTNTRSPSFNNVKIQATGGSGIDGTTVTHFTFTNGTISGSGDAVFESNIAFNDDAVGTESNVSGIVTITGNALSTAFDGGIDVRNGSGTISDAVIQNNTVTSTTSTATSKGSGIRLEFKGTASGVANITKATISGNTVTNFPSSAGIKVLGGNANAAGPAATIGNPASGTDVINITGNFVAGNSVAIRMGTNAIETAVSGKGVGNINISNNGSAGSPLTNVAGVGIALSAFGNVTVKGVINSNHIVANNTVNSSGISAGTDQTFGLTDTPDMTLTISNNNVSGVQGNGILAGAKNTAGITRITITGNTVAAPTVGSRPGIRVDSGTNLGGDTELCLDINNNTSAGSGGFPGIGVRKEGTNATTNAFGIEGLSPSPSNPNNVEDDIGAMNPGSAFGAAGMSNDGARTVRAIVLAGDNYVSCSSAP